MAKFPSLRHGQENGPQMRPVHFQARVTVLAATTAATSAAAIHHATTLVLHHAATLGTWAHAARASRWLSRQCHATLTCTLLHLVMMLVTDTFPFLSSLRRPEPITVGSPLLRGHQLAAINLITSLQLIARLQTILILIGRDCSTNWQHQSRHQQGSHYQSFHHHTPPSIKADLRNRNLETRSVWLPIHNVNY